MMLFFIDNAWVIWLAIAVLCFIFEIFTLGFYLACLGVGAFFAMIASFLSFEWHVQGGAFIVFTALSFAYLRPFAIKYLYKNKVVRTSNADAMIGIVGTVISEIKPGDYGRVAIRGEEWKAYSDSNQCLSVGTRVKIVERESMIVKVSDIQNNL